MVVVFISWYLLKHWLTNHRQSPHQSGIYEALYVDLHNRRPELWSNAGPHNHVRPKGRVSKIKWRLMVHWMSPKRLLPPKPLAGQILGNEPFGAYNRLKRYLVRKWTPEIEMIGGPPDPEVGLPLVGNGAIGYGRTTGLNLEGDKITSSEEGDAVLASGVEFSGVLVEEQMWGPERRGTNESATPKRRLTGMSLG